MERRYTGKRKTNETEIEITLDIDGEGNGTIETGIGFFDHMLEQVAKHGLIDIELKAVGDLNVDFHHTVEDVGIVLGEAIKAATTDKKGIKRYSTIYTPMDEALSMISIDASGRPFIYFDVKYTGERVGSFEVELVEEFFRAVAMKAEITLHINNLYGRNNHHIIESIFKAFGRAVREAYTIDDRIKGVMSTKGIL
ncbi:imidazoleglycerol-phosphate dehydratase HisB [Alkaliphilus peptidifermentans]|uniref:Imidazoleglycerol-phosphate dehydratase n=2 Tax=Alkaliphilus TaxID=114627 RepID=A0A1G5AD45_9FIRM|nr:imidazoleglycerol-phosphate dehydratase HisB [Alkaliphilus peptidifermentans]SCX75802.1 imidazoleglycerol-phosphate dehydratase [Alkaliphilus peptidifermentans DSM 18978]